MVVPDYGRILADSVARTGFHKSGLYAGACSIAEWGGIFMGMHRRLQASRATPAQITMFRQAIDRAIDVADELNDEQRTALHDALESAFDGIARDVRGDLAAGAQFLRHVTFAD